MTLDELVPLSGHVLSADGRPVAGIRVVATGNDYSPDTFRGQAITDADGRYEMKVVPEALLILGIEDDKWARPRKMQSSRRAASRPKMSISSYSRPRACMAGWSDPMGSRSPGNTCRSRTKVRASSSWGSSCPIPKKSIPSSSRSCCAG